MNLPYGETVTVERPGGTNRWGDTLPGTEHTSECWAFAPRTSSEDNEQANQVITGLTGYGPPGADVAAQDVIRRGDGTRWHVDGDIGQWGPSPLTGWHPGVEVALRRVTG